MSEIKPDISHTSFNAEKENREMSVEHAVVRPKSESPILIHGESADEEDESEDNPNPAVNPLQSANPENIDTEPNGRQSLEGSPV